MILDPLRSGLPSGAPVADGVPVTVPVVPHLPSAGLFLEGIAAMLVLAIPTFLSVTVIWLPRAIRF